MSIRNSFDSAKWRTMFHVFKYVNGLRFCRLKCYRVRKLLIQAFNKAECTQLLDKSEADITTLDPGNVFVGGRHHSLLPIMQEVYTQNSEYFFSVAVVKRGSMMAWADQHLSIEEQEGLFPWSRNSWRVSPNIVELFRALTVIVNLIRWVQLGYTLMQKQYMPIVDCNNHVKSASRFFGPSCAVDSLSDIYNPLGDNSEDWCRLCAGKVVGEKCTAHDPYAGYQVKLRFKKSHIIGVQTSIIWHIFL